MVLVGVVLVGHVAGIAAVGHLAHRIDTEERDDRPGRVAADLLLGDETLAGDDQPTGGTGQVQVGDGGAADATVTEAVSLVDVDGGHVGVERGDRQEFLAGERTEDDAGGAVAEGVGAEHRVARQKRHPHGRGLEAKGEAVIAPLGEGDLAGLKHPPGMRRQAAGLQANDVGDVEPVEQAAATEAVAGGEDLEGVGGGVAGDAEVLASLAEQFVQHRGGDAGAAEPPRGEIVAVADQAAHRLGDGGSLVVPGARPDGRPLAGMLRRGVGEERPLPARECVHGCGSWAGVGVTAARSLAGACGSAGRA